MTRLRTKGGASAQSLFDLVNGQLDASGAPSMRGGTRLAVTLPEGTIGLTYFDGERHVFSDHPVGGIPAGYHNNILRHPNDDTAELMTINFAEPIMGALYISATFEGVAGESTFHYWLVPAGAWAASTVYGIGSVVQPSTPDGFTYRAGRVGEPGIPWAPGVARAVNDVVEPTKYNGYEYVVIEVQGSNPRSGATEPAWLTSDGAIVYEDVDIGTSAPPAGPTGPTTQLPPEIEDRYNNRGGSGVSDQREIQ